MWPGGQPPNSWWFSMNAHGQVRRDVDRERQRQQAERPSRRPAGRAGRRAGARPRTAAATAAGGARPARRRPAAGASGPNPIRPAIANAAQAIGPRAGTPDRGQRHRRRDERRRDRSRRRSQRRRLARRDEGEHRDPAEDDRRADGEPRSRRATRRSGGRRWRRPPRPSAPTMIATNGRLPKPVARRDVDREIAEDRRHPDQREDRQQPAERAPGQDQQGDPAERVQRDPLRGERRGPGIAPMTRHQRPRTRPGSGQ